VKVETLFVSESSRIALNASTVDVSVAVDPLAGAPASVTTIVAVDPALIDTALQSTYPLPELRSLRIVHDHPDGATTLSTFE
jgi:hypothetical protein